MPENNQQIRRRGRPRPVKIADANTEIGTWSHLCLTFHLWYDIACSCVYVRQVQLMDGTQTWYVGETGNLRNRYMLPFDRAQIVAVFECEEDQRKMWESRICSILRMAGKRVMND